MKQVIKLITESVGKFRAHPDFKEWVSAQTLSADDVILINNSFFYRGKSRTTKSSQFLALKISEDGKINDNSVFVAQYGYRLNVDYKHIRAIQDDYPTLLPLETAVKNELSKLGIIVFILIGSIEDTEVLTETVKNDHIASITLDPTQSDDFRIEDDHIYVREASNEELIWSEILSQINVDDEEEVGKLQYAVADCLDRLQKNAIADVKLPASNSISEEGLVDAIVYALDRERKRYAKALDEQKKGKNDRMLLNEILRIAYNFDGDATAFLQLLFSICDLKPIILWGTIAEHYALSQAFEGLPIVKSSNKYKLTEYSEVIKRARNRAFHNLFPFTKTLRVQFSELRLEDAELRFFSEYGQKTKNELTYQDKQLVDVLTNFTRAQERHAPLGFWEKNLEIMDAMIALVQQTGEFLRALHVAQVQ